LVGMASIGKQLFLQQLQGGVHGVANKLYFQTK